MCRLTRLRVERLCAAVVPGKVFLCPAGRMRVFLAYVALWHAARRMFPLFFPLFRTWRIWPEMARDAMCEDASMGYCRVLEQTP